VCGCRWPCFFHERRPLCALVSPAGGAAFAVLGLHLKSKRIFDAREWSRWWDTADANRERSSPRRRPKDKQELDFSSIHTTSFKDPFFTGVYQKE
jgi:hypothetical protein